MEKKDGGKMDINQLVNKVSNGEIDHPVLKALIDKHGMTLKRVQESGKQIQQMEAQLKQIRQESQQLIGRAQELSELVAQFGNEYLKEINPEPGEAESGKGHLEVVPGSEPTDKGDDDGKATEDGG
jgi:transcription initiation factor TFIID subunit TAF12